MKNDSAPISYINKSGEESIGIPASTLADKGLKVFYVHKSRRVDQSSITYCNCSYDQSDKTIKLTQKFN